MAVMARVLAFGLLLCVSARGQDYARQIAMLQAEIDALESRVAQSEAMITSLKLGLIGPDRRADHKEAQQANQGNVILLDSFYADASTNATSTVSRSLEWLPTNVLYNMQANLYGFVTNGTYDTPDWNEWSYDDTDKYSVLMRWNRSRANGGPQLVYGSAPDVKAAVDNAATPDYVGADGSSGFLRIGQVDATEGLSKTDGGNFVTMAHYNTSAIDLTINLDALQVIDLLTFDTYGHTLTWAYRDITSEIDGRITTKVPNGTKDYQIIYWYNNAWNLLDLADLDYKVLQRKADDTLGYDYVRAHD